MKSNMHCEIYKIERIKKADRKTTDQNQYALCNLDWLVI